MGVWCRRARACAAAGGALGGRAVRLRGQLGDLHGAVRGPRAGAAEHPRGGREAGA